jgi:urease accessory protein
LCGDVSKLLTHAATLQGRRAFANLLHFGPRAEAELQNVRASLADSGCFAGVSAWNGMLSVRLVAHYGAALRQGVARVLSVIRGNLALPRVWQI